MIMDKAREDFTVLLVEDNQDDEELAKWALSKAGFHHVTVVRDGAEAVNVLLGGAADRSLPDLVLLDLRLPKIDGIDVLYQMRAHEETKKMKVIALSSSEDPRDKAICRELGVLAFLTKPLNEKILLSSL
jgi:CheY-like chemotaxis protein